MATETETATGAPPESTTPRRQRRSQRASGSRTRQRKPSPPQRVEPGWFHEALAETALKLLQRKGLDVGRVDDAPPIPMGEGAEPRDLLARIFAHMGHRLPLIKRFEKRLEGQDAKAGLGSDLLALVAQVYQRNEETLQGVVVEGTNQVRARREAKKADKNEPEIVGYVTDKDGAYYAVSRDGRGKLVDPQTLTAGQRAEAESRVIPNAD